MKYKITITSERGDTMNIEYLSGQRVVGVTNLHDKHGRLMEVGDVYFDMAQIAREGLDKLCSELVGVCWFFGREFTVERDAYAWQAPVDDVDGDLRYTSGRLGYNEKERRYGFLVLDLWERSGLHCGDSLDVWVRGHGWVHTRIEMDPDGLWYLIGTPYVGADLEGLRVRMCG